MAYVDGFIIPLPKKSIEAYRKMSSLACKVWMDHGAIDYRECVADDVKPGKLTSFPRSVIAKPSETVVFSWIVYKSRADRDRINAAVMKDPRLASMGPETCPFDPKRMIFGGFSEIVTPAATRKAAARKSPNKKAPKKASRKAAKAAAKKRAR